MERSEIDKVFELCLLLITVIAAAELQYTSFIYAENSPLTPLTEEQYLSNLREVNYTFRVTTIPIFFLVTTWIVLMLFPSITTRHRFLGKFRRFAKEFCWTLFGNFFVLEIIIFTYLGFSKEATSSMWWGRYGTLSSVLLTFLATWQYRKADVNHTQNISRLAFSLMSMLEHVVIYFVSYFLLLYFMYLSATIPIP